MTSYADAAAFRADLLEAGVLIASAVNGVYHRSGVFEGVLDGVTRYVAAGRVDQTAPRRWFPPVLPRTELVQTDYLRSFPDLIGSIEVFSGGDREHRALLAELEAGRDWTSALQPSEVMLSSSICHSLYATLPKAIPADGLGYECCGFGFRHEPSLDPVRMQSFRMYEFVAIGTPEQAVAHREEWLARGVDSLRALGLEVRPAAANDPFFGRVGQMLSNNQLESGAKSEVVADLTGSGPTALASANYHGDHFGEPFGLRTAGDQVAHSACFGYGLERVTLALFATHGLAPQQWPDPVREALGC